MLILPLFVFTSTALEIPPSLEVSLSPFTNPIILTTRDRVGSAKIKNGPAKLRLSPHVNSRVAGFIKEGETVSIILEIDNFVLIQGYFEGLNEIRRFWIEKSHVS